MGAKYGGSGDRGRRRLNWCHAHVGEREGERCGKIRVAGRTVVGRERLGWADTNRERHMKIGIN